MKFVSLCFRSSFLTGDLILAELHEFLKVFAFIQVFLSRVLSTEYVCSEYFCTWRTHDLMLGEGARISGGRYIQTFSCLFESISGGLQSMSLLSSVLSLIFKKILYQIVLEIYYLIGRHILVCLFLILIALVNSRGPQVLLK